MDEKSSGPDVASSGEHPDSTFVLTRVFDAPRELVWKAWTEAERLERWWGPRRCTASVIKLDLHPGGIFHYALHWPQGQDMWGKFVYREIAAPERLVFVNSFADEEGRIAPAPHIKIWPMETLSTVTFAEADGQTAVTISWTPINATDEERKVFAGAFESIQAGWSGSLDQLSKHLANG